MQNSNLSTSLINTPLGHVLAVADGQFLYLLDFTDRLKLPRLLERLKKKTGRSLIEGKTAPIHQIEKELKAYFSGSLKEFKTPLCFLGSPFQKRVWEELEKIPTGKTKSYAEIAIAIEKPTAFRAVALANGANPFPIIIPCHRVINSDGRLGGYGGGLERKEWLLKHES